MDRNIKILFISPGHFFATGYGYITREIATYLQNQGYEVHTLSNVLLSAEPEGYVLINGLKTYPKVNDNFYRDILPVYLATIKPDIAFSIWDVWIWYVNGINYWQIWKQQIKARWVPYVPIDADLFEGCPIVEVLKASDHMVAMSQYGYNQLSKFFDRKDITFIPHFVDTKVFRPIDKEEAWKIIEEHFNFTKEKIEKIKERDPFIVNFVGENLSERKDIPRLMRAFKKFLNMVSVRHPKYKDRVFLQLRTNVVPSSGTSFDIYLLVKKLGLDNNVIVIANKVPKHVLNALYNVSTVYASASRGEGFGIPIIESMATGKPAILPDNSAHREHIVAYGKELRGWLVKSNNEAEVLWTDSLQAYPVVDVNDFANKLYKVFLDWINGGQEIEAKGKNALYYAESLDKEKILPQFDLLFKRLMYIWDLEEKEKGQKQN